MQSFQDSAYQSVTTPNSTRHSIRQSFNIYISPTVVEHVQIPQADPTVPPVLSTDTVPPVDSPPRADSTDTRCYPGESITHQTGMVSGVLESGAIGGYRAIQLPGLINIHCLILGVAYRRLIKVKVVVSLSSYVAVQTL